MKRKVRISDLITTSRVIGVTIFSLIISYRPEFFGLIPGIVLILVIILTDFLDGMMARKLKETSEFGAFYDIVGDRITEIVMLLPYVYLGIASPIFPMYFVVKGFLVDYQRLYRYVRMRKSPFKQVRDKLSKFLVASPYIRSTYLISKIAMIILFYMRIFKESENLEFISIAVAVLAVVISISRTVPAFFTPRGEEAEE